MNGIDFTGGSLWAAQKRIASDDGGPAGGRTDELTRNRGHVIVAPFACVRPCAKISQDMVPINDAFDNSSWPRAMHEGSTVNVVSTVCGLLSK